MKKTKQMSRVLKDVIKERQRQDDKWGEQNHNPFKYFAILIEEVGEVGRALCDGIDFKRKKVEFEDHKHYQNYRDELIQVAAVAVAMVECLDRGKWCK